MNSSSTSHPTEQPIPGRPLPRDLFLVIARQALFVRETRFARQAALAWLIGYPGDLPVSLLYARALVEDGRPDQALPVLEELCEIDPEFVEAAGLLTRLRYERGLPTPPAALGSFSALGGKPDSSEKGVVEQTVVVWSRLIGQARVFLEKGDLLRADQFLHQALAAKPDNPLVAATHLKILQAQKTSKTAPPQALRSLAEFYHNRWPGCLQCTLLLADALMDGGEPEKAVALLHQAAARDVTGQVARRLWGENHPYRALWPDHLEILLDFPIPAGVAASMGWNRLPMGQISTAASPGFQEAPVEMPEKSEPDASLIPEVLSEVSLDGLPGETVESPGEASLCLQSGKGFSKIPKIDPVDPPPMDRKRVEQEHSDISEGQQPPHEDRPAPAYPPVPESLRSVQAELERVAGRINRPGLARSEGRLPVYIIMTTRRNLESIYGNGSATEIEAEMKRLVEAVQARWDWRAMLFYADEGACWQGKSMTFLVPPAKPNDPWGLKLALADLDSVLKHKGEMIGAVLIVGGPEVVPFHRLPNPVDDTDEDVPSDNPYGTRDENYFIPEWPVGRLPGGAGGRPADAEPLLHALRTLSSRHAIQAKRRKSRQWYHRGWEHLAAWLSRYVPSPGRVRPSVGYTAAIWRKASISVFRPIGQPRAMLVSPPVQAAPDQDPGTSPTLNGKQKLEKDQKGLRRGNHLNGKQGSTMPAAKLAYFNLHGLEDAVEWYGQKDPYEAAGSSANDGPDYPVALRPQDITNHGSAPQVVFSEACYGAHILGKTIEDALVLQFLQAGSQAVVGSTVTAYGSVNEPLIAADFLGQAFWNYLRKGWPAGEALRRAKISLAQEMHRRQGYLDGEDQKTLISFVLYGDPLAQPLIHRMGPKSILRPLNPPAAVRTVCDKARKEERRESIPPEVLTHVKQVVEQYLPGMADASVTLSQEHSECEHSGHECPTSQLRKRAVPLQKPNRRVIILSKQVSGASHLHRHYARITLDDQNKIVKLVVSR